MFYSGENVQIRYDAKTLLHKLIKILHATVQQITTKYDIIIRILIILINSHVGRLLCCCVNCDNKCRFAINILGLDVELF